MNLDLAQIAKLFTRFHTSTGQLVCMHYIKADFIKPKWVLATPPVMKAKEPAGDKKADGIRCRKIVGNLCAAIGPAEKWGELLEAAENEAKPILLQKDYERFDAILKQAGVIKSHATRQ